jgi:ribosomal protein S18 acetylase RimI-like enzyme
MEANKGDDRRPELLHVEPVLAVRNVSETVQYWLEVLGFSNQWTWGDPPNHGGVSWQGAAFVQFSQNAELAAVSAGHSVWIRVRHIETLYALHREKQAKIVALLEKKPWGMAEYTVEEMNGYFLHFSAPDTEWKQHAEKLPLTVRIIARTPTVTEHHGLAVSVGWSSATGFNPEAAKSLLDSVVFSVVAENIQTGEVVGCALLFGDRSGFYYVKDVMVHPDWQGKRVGTTLMQEITRWTEANAPDGATVGLFTGEHLARFYRQFGFTQACGMYRQIHRS